MPTGAKIGIGLVVVLLMLAGSAYGLAKIGVIPVKKLAARNKIAAAGLQAIGLVKPEPKKKTDKPAPDPLAGERKALLAQRIAMEQEKANWQMQIEAQRKAEVDARLAARNSAPDPKEVARLASVYEQMATEAVGKIFAKLPDDQVIGLLRRMDEKKVAEVLAGTTPERAARLTLALSRPVPTPPERLATNR